MRVRLSLAGALCACACATPMAEQHPTLANIQLLRTAEMPSFALGDFHLAPGLPARIDHSVSVRADSLTAPGDGSFAHYLRSTLETELRGAGKLDPASSIAINGELTQSAIGSDPSAGHGLLGARFRVVRGDHVLYEKELIATDTWPSDWIGAVAIPLAEDRYTALYPKLVTNLLSDPEFRAAVRAGG